MNRIARIGLDLDNTIIDYSVAAKKYATDNGFRMPENLANLRIDLRALGDLEWQKAQAWLYTEGLTYAKPAAGWNHFLQKIFECEVQLYIVSHKTRVSTVGLRNLNLHSYAMDWLENVLNISDITQLQGVFFLPTREAKIEKLASLKLDCFVDDLVEVLTDSKFPTSVKRILFNSNSNPESMTSVASFFELTEKIFDDKSYRD